MDVRKFVLSVSSAIFLSTVLIFALSIALSPFISFAQETHKVCDNFSCVEVQGKGVSQCNTDADCDTECTVDNKPTGTLYEGDKCGACTGQQGACYGKKVGARCTLKVGNGNTKVKGKCVASNFCSSMPNYSGACGMQCACDLKPDKMLPSLMQDIDEAMGLFD
ncbi:MAG: hypothetical protein D6808_05185 [Candidatus Dadabacteria bacterium]|nr:MAG: hypothetical protein D6808_05185 [Candidatus Dadabacteria bacterium]